MNETWTWDGHWTSHGTQSVPALLSAVMGYDDARQQVVLVGTRSGQSERETWTWDGRRWTHQPGLAPIVGSTDQMAYDPSAKVLRMVAHGEMWTWDGRAWTEHPSDGPSDVYGACVTYSSGSRGMFVFSGNYFGTYSRTPWVWRSS